MAISVAYLLASIKIMYRSCGIKGQSDTSYRVLPVEHLVHNGIKRNVDVVHMLPTLHEAFILMGLSQTKYYGLP